MKLIKKITKKPFFRKFLCFLGYLYIRFVFFTSRNKIKNAKTVEEFKRNNQPMIFAFWHGHLLLMPCFAQKYKKMSVIISHNRDGDIISHIAELFGIETVRGSTSKGGKKAVLEAVNQLKQRKNLGITPDGPRGPRMKAAKGAAVIAKLSGCPIIPIGFASSRAKILDSWDRFIVPLPFGKTVLSVGEPIFANKSSDEDEITDKIESAMKVLTSDAKNQLKNNEINTSA